MTNDLVERAETLPAVENGHPQAQSLLPAIIALAKDETVDVEKLEALLRMQERMEARQAEAEFNAAFARLSAQLPRVKKNGEIRHPVERGNLSGPTRKISSYAKFEDIDAAIRDTLRNEGFAITFETAQRQGEGGGLIVTATLLHAAGHSRSASIPVPLDTSGAKNNIQGYGSALSYGRRYSLCAVLNIVTEGEDDDGVRGDMEFIDDDKVRQINDLIRETKSDARRFMQYMGVERIPDITVADFPRAVAQLERKKREHAQ